MCNDLGETGRCRWTHNRTVLLVTAALLLSAALITLFILVLPECYRRAVRAPLEVVRVGMSEPDVRGLLGAPHGVARTIADFSDCDGYFPVPHMRVENKVLVYYSDFPMWKLYVYIGRDGRVSHLFWAMT